MTIGFAVLPQCTALDPPSPKQAHVPRTSASAARRPSHRTRRTRRPTSSIHIAVASSSSSRATAHDGSTSGKESPSTFIRQPEDTGSVLSSVCRVSWNTPLDASPLVSRETGPSPRGMPPCRPRQSSGARCRYRIHRACPVHDTRYVPTEADASTTLFRGRRSSIPSGTTYSSGGLQRPHCSDIRLVLTCYST